MDLRFQSPSERSSVRMAPCVQLDPITERTSCKDGVRHTSIISGRILDTDDEDEAEGEAMLCSGRGECLHEHDDYDEVDGSGELPPGWSRQLFCDHRCRPEACPNHAVCEGYCGGDNEVCRRCSRWLGNAVLDILDDADAEEECACCMDAQATTRLPSCTHRFCARCVNTLAFGHTDLRRRCPTCRSDLPAAEFDVEDEVLEQAAVADAGGDVPSYVFINI